ncbi:MAG: hypothetical protein H0T84_00835 [Tatlockia sp.]|nr:hypothetical protein [Tatlockia sp.]
MTWNDVCINKKICLSKFFYCEIACIALFIILIAIRSMIMHTNLENIIVAMVSILAFAYFGGCNIYIILNGSKFIKTIKQEDDYFELTNVFGKQRNFTFIEVIAVVPSRFTIMDKFFTDFPKQPLGLDLILKNGRKYRISSDMENIDTLKEHLLSKKKY